jgi:hypothetical protein
MKIILEAEVMDQQAGVSTPSMYLPGHCAVRLKVVLGRDSAAQEFQQDVILRLDQVQSVFDLLMKNLTRNMRDALASYLEDKSYLEKFPLMPVLGVIHG